jgi:DNA repair exonuclease SbcCD ATPase subunit
LPDTDHKTKFDAWVKDRIGLDYETFTSSVVLLQGKAEKLLDATPAGRAGVLARIVDLERYQRLHAKADDRRKECKGSIEEIEKQLSVVAEVSEAELTAAAAKVAEAEAGRTLTRDRIDVLQELELQAMRWNESRTRLEGTRKKLREMETLLDHAVAIENSHRRFRELHDVLPAVGTVVTERGRIGESERKSEQYAKDQKLRTADRGQAIHALDQARKKLASLRKTLSEDETAKSRLDERLR